VIALVLAVVATASPPCPPFEEVAARVWEFRARTMPFSADDIPRMERPAGMVRSWSRATVDQQRVQVGALATCLKVATAKRHGHLPGALMFASYVRHSRACIGSWT